MIKIIRILFIKTSKEDLTNIDEQGINEEIIPEAVFPPTFTKDIWRHIENVRSAIRLHKTDSSEFKHL